MKPVLIGTMHGLAGSGALTLLVLTQIKSAWLGLLYLAVFGVGSIVGMLGTECYSDARHLNAEFSRTL